MLLHILTTLTGKKVFLVASRDLLGCKFKSTLRFKTIAPSRMSAETSYLHAPYNGPSGT